MNVRQWIAGLASGIAMAGAAEAALIDRGSGLIYDSDLNVTWLSDMNHAKTSGYDADGLMNWSQAQAWADNLVFGGFSDWRLPTLSASDTSCNASVTPAGFPTQYFGYNCAGGELSHLFVTELGNSSHNTNNFASSVTDPTGDTAQQVANLKLFSNVTAGVYWSGTEYAPTATVSGNQNAWSFYSNYGLQSNIAKANLVYALAVRSGDVIAPPPAPVPEPTTLALPLAGLRDCAAARIDASRRRPVSDRRKWGGPGHLLIAFISARSAWAAIAVDHSHSIVNSRVPCRGKAGREPILNLPYTDKSTVSFNGAAHGSLAAIPRVDGDRQGTASEMDRPYSAMTVSRNRLTVSTPVAPTFEPLDGL